MKDIKEVIEARKKASRKFFLHNTGLAIAAASLLWILSELVVSY